MIEWWAKTDPKGWRRATRAEVYALTDPNDECLAWLLSDGEQMIRSSTIRVAGGEPVRLSSGEPWLAEFYTVQATEYKEVLREVETQLAEIAEELAL